VQAMEVKLFYNAKGNVEKAVYLMRKIKGRPLKSLSAGEVFLYKQQMSRHRALAVLIGDYDRHIGNYFVTNEGHLVPLDAGLADVVGELDFGKGPADPVLMEGVYGRDHYYSRYFKDEIAAKDANGNRLAERAPEIDLFDPNESFNRKGLVAEESLTYKDSLQTVDKIKDIVSDEQEFRKVIQDTYEGAFKTDEIIKQRIEIVKDIKERTNAERIKRQMEPFKIDPEQIRRDVITDIDGEIKQMVDRTVETAKSREVRLKEVMKGLDQRHVVPRRTSQVSAPESEIFRRVVFLNILKPTVLRRAA